MKRKIEAMHAEYGTRHNICKYCPHFRRYLMPGGRAVLKCRAYGVTRSEATDWRANWPACGMFDKQLPPLSLYVPMIERIKHAERKKPEEPVKGQIEMEGLT